MYNVTILYCTTRLCNFIVQVIKLYIIQKKTHVLICICCRCKETCPKLVDFFENKQITFASVDIREDRITLGHANITIPEKYHVDIQDMYKSEDKFYNNPPFYRDGLGYLAETMIDTACGSLKTDFPCRGHDFWETKPLSALQIGRASCRERV